MKAHQKSIGITDDWLTPPEITQNLGPFDLDPACPDYINWPIASRCLTMADDGLTAKWNGRVWLNPPFNRKDRPAWMHRMAQHRNGIMLIPAATETKAFYDHVWTCADAICFVKGRPHFLYPSGDRAPFNCGTAICLVAYGSVNVCYLRNANLGKTICLS